MACSVRLHKGATLPPPRLHIHMHRRIFLANIRKPFANPAPELRVKPRAHGGPPSPGKKGKPKHAEKRYERPLLVYCPRNPEECKLLLSSVFFKAQHSSVSQGSPLFPSTLPQNECPLGKAEKLPREAQPHCSWQDFCPSHLYRISIGRSSTSSPILKKRDHTATELN